ncbi:hypothetical protein SNEBB_005968 [Seison nebaliae]|nr:hypothetical protein SNEBB_005968 [Seison nebaliae]
MSEILLDSDIRIWVFLPIAVISLLVGIIRHYLTLYFVSDRKVELNQIADSQLLLKSKVLRENGIFIPKEAYLIRRHRLLNNDDGLLLEPSSSNQKKMLQNPNQMADMMKGSLFHTIPTIIIGGWINWMFSGFLCTKVPFPLTFRFKPMLQRGVELVSLDASWVSSLSWYFINVFGLRSIFSLILGENNAAADQSRMMQEQMSGAAASLQQQDLVQLFKNEREALTLREYFWDLENIDEFIARSMLQVK